MTNVVKFKYKIKVGDIVTVRATDKGRDIYFTGKVSMVAAHATVVGWGGLYINVTLSQLRPAKLLDRLLYF